MKEKNILFQIKELDKTILRTVLTNKNISDDCIMKQNPTQMRIIGYILENRNSDVFQKDLEEKFNLRRATISDVLKRMEKRELIKRIPNPNDIRSKKIILADKANTFFNENHHQIDDLEKKAIKNISDEELEIFTNVLAKMISNLNNN